MTALSAGAVLVALSAAAFLALGVPLSRGIATAHRTVRGRGPMNEPTAEPRTAAGRRLLWDGPSMDIRGAPTDLRQTILAIEAEARAAASGAVAGLRSALEAIAIAERRVRWCPTPGNCMYPQHHAGDETRAEFADRLRGMASTALAATPAPAPAGEPEISALISDSHDHGPSCGICEAQVLRGRAAMTLAATPPDAGAREADETAWLIERGQSLSQVPTVWWTGIDPPHSFPAIWTTNAFEARRFPDGASAQREIDLRSRAGYSARSFTFGVAVEHLFIAATPTGATAGAREAEIAALRTPDEIGFILDENGRMAAEIAALRAKAQAGERLAAIVREISDPWRLAAIVREISDPWPADDDELDSLMRALAGSADSGGGE